MNLRKKLATPIIRETKGDCKMDKEKLMKMIDNMVDPEIADAAKEPVSIVYKRNQTDKLDFHMEIKGNTISLFAAICEIAMIWALGFDPEDREDQIRYMVDVCIAGLKNEDYVTELKHYLEMD